MKKVGIVIVTYNRSDVTCLALESLVAAKNSTYYEVCIVDNASLPHEFFKIKECFDNLTELGVLNGELISSDKNLGFSGGNNVGLRRFLQRNDITHICLLNNDTIVTPFWIDQMIAHQPKGLLGPVSNSVGNEQLVPVDYSVVLANGYTRKIVFDFAHNWNVDHQGQIVSTDMLGFFCVFGAKEVFQAIGELDEAFGIGTFEDDDYCIRAIKLGFPLQIARDVFVHHWGSASFSRIGKKKLIKLMKNNRSIFENKHKVKWESPIVKIMCGYKAEIENNMSQTTGSSERRKVTIEKYGKIIAGNIAFLFRPFDPLNAKRRLVSFGLTFSPPAGLIDIIKFIVKKPLEVKRYLNDIEYRIRVKSRLSYWKHSLVRLVKKKIYNAFIQIRPSTQVLICFPICPYSGRRQRPQQLIEKLSAHFQRIYWIAPQDVTHRGAVRLFKNFYEVYLKGKINNFYSTQVSLLEKDLVDQKQLNLLVPSKGQVVVVVQNLYWLGHIVKLREIAKSKGCKIKVVYDCMDHHTGFGSSLLVTAVHEKNIIDESDLLIASSDKIESQLKLSGKPVVKIKNACSVEDFPLHMNPPQDKVVGYFGAIAEWFDWDLVKSAAEKLPHIRFELIGDYGNLFHVVDERPANIHFFGEKPFYELKAYAKNWSAALIPFRITPLIEATNPVKLYEYNSLGMPVISTPIPEVISEASDVVIVNDSSALVSAIERVISEDRAERRQERREFAERNTWDARGKSVIEAFNEFDIY